MIKSVETIFRVLFVSQIVAKMLTVKLGMEKLNLNIRIETVAKRDTQRVSKRSIQAQEWSLDVNPHKSTKKAKAKERQAGKKDIEKYLKSKI